MSYYYAVRDGRAPGVYRDWPSCQKQVTRFSKARFKKFRNESEAWDFVDDVQTNNSSDDEPFSGRPYQSSTASFSAGGSVQNYRKRSYNDFTPLGGAGGSRDGNFKNGAAKSYKRMKSNPSRCTDYGFTDEPFSGRPYQSPTASFSAGGSVRNYRKCSYNDFTPLGGAGSSRDGNFKNCAAKSYKRMKSNPSRCTDYGFTGRPYQSPTASFSAGGSVQNYQKRSYSDFTPLGGAGGSRDGNFKNGAAKSYKRMKSNPSGCTDYGFTGVPFPDQEGTVVHTDGASFDNGHATARAGIGIYWGLHDPFNTSERLSGRQTNNRAEIHAAEVAVLQAKQRGIKNLILYTDSQFLINGVTAWNQKWKENGWKLSTGGDVINRDDFEKLDEAVSGINIKWMHVRGHRGIEGNEAADRLANAGAAKPLF